MENAYTRAYTEWIWKSTTCMKLGSKSEISEHCVHFPVCLHIQLFIYNHIYTLLLPSDLFFQCKRLRTTGMYLYVCSLKVY
jgi:hypothetical protein